MRILCFLFLLMFGFVSPLTVGAASSAMSGQGQSISAEMIAELQSRFDGRVMRVTPAKEAGHSMVHLLTKDRHMVIITVDDARETVISVNK